MTALDRSWLDRAACIDTPVDVFFPTDKADATPAKQVCETCPVIEECLRYAVAAGETQGVWGGKTPRERSRWAGRQGLVRHGTLAGYRNDGCRCDRCRKANTDHCAERRGGRCHARRVGAA